MNTTAAPPLITFLLQGLVAALTYFALVDCQHSHLESAWYNGGCCQKLETERAVQALESMVAACLRKDADKRPSATQLLKDPVLKHGHDHKWLAKRLSGLDKSSRRASSMGDDSSAHSPASSSHSTSSVAALLGLTSAMSGLTCPLTADPPAFLGRPALLDLSCAEGRRGDACRCTPGTPCSPDTPARPCPPLAAANSMWTRAR